MTACTIFLATETDTLDFATKLAQCVESGSVIFLQGQLGTGKTTFARGFLQGLGYTGKVKSPTYTLVESYSLEHKKIFHFDFYRLNNAQELEFIGINEYFSKEFINLIEWPEKAFPFLPPADLICTLTPKDSGREIQIEAPSETGNKIVSLF